jgi:hypothetical protein
VNIWCMLLFRTPPGTLSSAVGRMHLSDVWSVMPHPIMRCMLRAYAGADNGTEHVHMATKSAMRIREVVRERVWLAVPSGGENRLQIDV